MIRHLLLACITTIFGLSNLVCAASPSNPSDPLPEHIHFQNLLENKDIPLGEIHAFLQDQQGFMWIGCGGGLVRYDGYEFKFILKTVLKENQAEKQPVKNVNHIYQDNEHMLWVSTRTGLLRYDPQKDLLIQIPDDPETKTTLSTTNINSTFQLPSGELLLLTQNGLFELDRKTYRYTAQLVDTPKQQGLHSNILFTAHLSADNTLWLGTNAGIEKIDWAKKLTTLIKLDPEHPELLEANSARDIIGGNDGTLWIATGEGLVHYDHKTEKIQRYLRVPNNPHSLSSNQLTRLMIDNNGTLWIASDGGGITIFERNDQFPQGRFTNHKSDQGHFGSLNSNVSRTVFQDRAGDVWVGNYPTGINYFDRSSVAITSYRRDPDNPNSLSHNSIMAIQEDANHNLWLGTDGGGLNYFDREKNQFTQFKKQSGNYKSLSGNSVLSLFIADDGKIWVGTWGAGISVLNPETGEFLRMPYDPRRTELKSTNNSHRLNSTSVWTINSDSTKAIWIGTHAGGLNRYDRTTDTYNQYVPSLDDTTSITNKLVWSTLEDSRGNFWVGTAGGLNLMDREAGTFRQFRVDPKSNQSLSNSNVNTLYEDKRQRLWIGTDSGLNRLNEDGETFTVFDKSAGLNDDSIRAIVGDNSGQLWLATNSGVSVFNPETKAVKNYNREGGRLIGQLNTKAGILSSKGEVIFGGVEGLRIFNPKKMEANSYIPPIVFTDLKIFTTSVKVGHTDGLLSQSVNFTDTIVLDYTMSMFQLDFAALNFRDSSKNSYAYILEGFDKDWLQVGDQRSAKYTNLNPGTYVFRVRGSNNDNIWNDQGAAIKIIQLPPSWKTGFAYTLYIAIICFMLAAFVYSQRKQLAYERLINLRMRNLDNLKENFLANTSHELRTPLYGIIGLAESISASGAEASPEIIQKAKMILSSGQRLATIINDIMEFSQLANNELALTLTSTPLRSVINRAITNLDDRLNSKPIQLICDIPDEVVVFSNEQKLSQIIYRIIENAIKFTSEGTINITHRKAENFDVISIQDTGIGIASENIETIFSAFQQVDGSAKRDTEGAGLGLSVIQKLVELHQGKINIESTPGKGTTFHIWLPHPEELDKAVAEQPSQPPLNDNATANAPVRTKRKNLGRKFKVLIVDDDPVNRMVIASQLQRIEQIETTQAIDGDEALRKLNGETDIDLVILDVMMPRMTGYELCELIRQKHSADELPIIFLTANHQSNEVSKAFAAGGNDFVTKPIGGRLLRQKVKSQLALLSDWQG